MIAHGKNVKIFSGNSNIALSKSIADILGVPIGNSKVGKFSDGEVYVSTSETVRGSREHLQAE